ncbi:hypothetical protein [Marinifilum caeruleilacunae]|uniref:Right handed beta helix domain-containing protein n=1 Tax=Marinifilum caeruleilacunae TaxID=2499076 RepID=A0ABX1WVN6_9BACT|nr:hypothetical protein [Marinifilum caeruleilacunae]NOU60066.1 hypothetical protein [Marinifilum caeruleilacunae]
MKKTLLLTLILVAFTFASQAQQKVLLQHAGTPSLHTTISDAITAAVANDTIYIPGFTYNESLTIDKKLTIIGTGHYQDSTAASGMTKINGSINFKTGCDQTKVEGVYISSSVNTSSQTINEVKLIRSRIGGLVSLDGTIDGFTISECVLIGGVNSSTTGIATNILIENSIVQGNIRYFRNSSTVQFCVLLVKNSGNSTAGHIFYNCEGMNINSNVILDQYASIPNTCTFTNNLFRVNYATYMDVDDTNNIFDQDITSIFEHLETDQEYKFHFANDYHLKASSPGVGAASDGTNIGIYGSSIPYKASAVPSNPHFFKVNIASENDADGKLSVELGVQAQDR